MLRMRHLPAFLGIALIAEGIPAEPRSPLAQLSLQQQAGDMPADFLDHFFNVPLASRVVADGQYLGEAMLVLTKDDRVQLLHFTDTIDSDASPEVRDRLLTLLRTPAAIAACERRGCNGGFRRIVFDSASSTLDVVTWEDARTSARASHRQAPKNSTGVILNQRANLVSDPRGGTSGRYWVDLLGSVAGWTTSLGVRHEKNTRYERSDTRQSRGRVRIQDAFIQRELKNSFVRIGRFLPASLGLYQQPGNYDGRDEILVGAMLGSSDSLLVDPGTASTYPIYVTASRNAIVEIFRNGSLIHTQQIASGLQPLDTRPLPGGIYAVEVRVIEDGVLTSTSNQQIYKPTLWTDTSRRWRYNLFAGQSHGTYGSNSRKKPAFGGAVNYLLHPRAVLGLSMTSAKGRHSAAITADIEGTSWANLHTAFYRTSDRGSGSDTQLLLRIPRGNLVLGYGDSWLNRLPGEKLYGRRRRTWSMASNVRTSARSQASARIARDRSSRKGIAYDMGIDRNLLLARSNSTLRISAFDRPLVRKNRRTRDRGFEVGLSIALSSPTDTWSASAGQRSGAKGGRDNYASVQYVHQRTGIIPQVTASLTGDRYGLGAGGDVYFQAPFARGNVFAQRSSLNNQLTGGLNLENSLAIGGGHATSSGAGDIQFAQAVMAVDLEGDAPSVIVRATDRISGSTVLHHGRNLIPLKPYTLGHINFDIDAQGDAAVLDKRTASYHVNRGGVVHTRIKAIRTQPALGRLVDHERKPIAGATIVNAAGRAVSEASGIFSLEMGLSDTSLTVHRNDAVICTIAAPTWNVAQSEHLAMLGDIRCGSPSAEPGASVASAPGAAHAHMPKPTEEAP